MKHIQQFLPRLASERPDTLGLLLNGNLVIHDLVIRVTLHGSRGFNGHARPNSDIDLALVLDDFALLRHNGQESLLKEVLATTLDNWQGNVEVDLAAVFDKKRCGLPCLKQEGFNFQSCRTTTDCMGVYKIQRGFTGYVDSANVDCRKMQPSMAIWESSYLV